MSSLRTSADSDAEPEEMENERGQVNQAVGVGGWEGVKAAKTDHSPGRACAPQVRADVGSSHRGPACGEPFSVFGRRRQSSLLGKETQEGMRRASTQREMHHYSDRVRCRGARIPFLFLRAVRTFR